MYKVVEYRVFLNSPHLHHKESNTDLISVFLFCEKILRKMKSLTSKIGVYFSVRTTLEVYSHMFEKQNRKAIDVINKLTKKI